MTKNFLSLISVAFLTFGKVLALFPTIALFANILSGDVADTIFLTENLEEDLS